MENRYASVEKRISEDLIDELGDEGCGEHYRKIISEIEKDKTRGWTICPLAYDGCLGAKNIQVFDGVCSALQESVMCLYREIITEQEMLNYRI